MNKRQLVSAWIFAFVWAVTLFFWYVLASDSWGFTQFMQATAFVGVFASLTHISLRITESEKILRLIESLISSGKHQEALQLIFAKEKSSETDNKLRLALLNYKRMCAAFSAMAMYQDASCEVSECNYDKALIKFDQLLSFVRNNLNLFGISEADFVKFREQVFHRIGQFNKDVLPQEILGLREEFREFFRKTSEDKIHGEVYGMLIDAFLAEVLINAKKKTRNSEGYTA